MPKVVTGRLGALFQLLRIKPVASWGLSAFALGVSVALYEVGVDINLFHGGLALLMVVLTQGFVSHGLNDAYDWITGTDKKSIGKGTGGSRVIPEGKMTVVGTLFVSCLALAGTLGIGWYFIQQYGTPMVVLLGIAVWAPVSYSVPPLKLGYRPFNEMVVALPALVGVVAGTALVLAGTVSVVAILVGWVHAMFCIGWFVVSRVPDYEPDKRVGKVTSVVHVGRDNAKLLSAGYLAFGLAVVGPLAVRVSPVFIVSAFAWGLLMVVLSELDPYDAEKASEVRLRMMHLTTGHAIGVAVGLPLAGGV
jgi:1,4-dihydroxy-2-naphthoate octaprenyltransferase